MIKLIVIPLLLSLAACDVAGNVISAPGRVANKTLETDNIIMNYELFHDENQNFTARINQIQEHSADLKGETDKSERSRLRMELEAQQQSCRELAADYNANSRKLNRKVFKDRGLPVELDSSSCEISSGA